MSEEETMDLSDENQDDEDDEEVDEENAMEEEGATQGPSEVYLPGKSPFNYIFQPFDKCNLMHSSTWNRT